MCVSRTNNVNRTQQLQQATQAQAPAKQAETKAINEAANQAPSITETSQKAIKPETAEKYFKMAAQPNTTQQVQTNEINGKPATGVPTQVAQTGANAAATPNTAQTAPGTNTNAGTNQAQPQNGTQPADTPVTTQPVETPNQDPVYLKDGQVYVRGGEGADEIGLSRGKENGYTVNYNGKDYNFGDDVTGFNVHGGAGDDKISIEEGLLNVKVHGGAGDDTINNKSNFAKIHGGQGDDKINNAAHGADIRGGLGDDTVTSRGHLNTIRTHAGDDKVNVQGNLNSVRGGRGNDTVNAQGSFNAISGNRGADQLNVSAGNGNVVRGGRGGDTIGVSGFSNHIRGGRGADKIAVFGNGNNVIGNRGADQIAALGWGNKVRGGRGQDAVWNNGFQIPERRQFQPAQANAPFQQAPMNQQGIQANAPFQPNPAQNPQLDFLNNFMQLIQQLQPQQQLQMLGWLLPALMQGFNQQPPVARPAVLA